MAEILQHTNQMQFRRFRKYTARYGYRYCKNKVKHGSVLGLFSMRGKYLADPPAISKIILGLKLLTHMHDSTK